ncbi:MAG: trehalose synthase, partial [Chloroflexota bacterium]|nr:trehalose synthase [Chloroflexota bacterium]
MAVRAPMQWTSSEGGGFSSAPMTEYVRPILAEGPYGYEETNVASQRGNPESLLNWIASLVRTRKESSEIGYGAWSVMDTGNDAVFAIRYDDHESAIIVLNNLSGQRQNVSLDLEPQELERTTDLLGDNINEPVIDASAKMRLNGYGCRWLRVGGAY